MEKGKVLYEKVKAFKNKRFCDLYFLLCENERKSLYITDKAGRQPKMNGILKVYKYAIIIDLHYKGDKVYITLDFED